MERRLCFTAEEDELLVRGWPRCVRLVDDHPDNRRPVSSARAYFAGERSYGAEWPREVARQVLRANGSQKSSRTVGRAEAKSFLARMLVARDGAFAEEQQVTDAIYIVEAIAGSDDTLETVASAFEQPAGRDAPPGLVHAPATLSFLMLRASSRARDHLRPLFEVSRERAGRAGWDACVRNFDLSLRGARAVKETLLQRREPCLELLDYAADDPEYVRALVARLPFATMSVRAVQIGGLETMGRLARRCLRAFPASEFPHVLRDFGMIKAPETVDLALALVGRMHVKDAPLRWLLSHADYARPLVEDLARRGSPLAKTVRRKLAGSW